MKKKRTGVITVEAIMVMPIVIGVILLLYSIIVIQYNNILFRTAAIQATNRIAANWSQIDGRDYTILDEDKNPVIVFSGQTSVTPGRTGKNVITSASYQENDPYATILGLVNVGEKSKMQKAENYLDYMMNQAYGERFDLLELERESDPEKKIGALEVIFGGNFKVTVTNTYRNALLDIMKGFGYDLSKSNTVTIKASFNDPVEFIRNIDFVKEMIQDAKEKKADGNKAGD